MGGRNFFLTAILLLGVSANLGAWIPSQTDISEADRALQLDLQECSVEEYSLVLQEVYAAFDEHSRAHRYEAAIFLAQAMYSNADGRGQAYLRTRIWAASTLGLIQTRAGLHTAAEETVSREIESLRAELLRLTRELGNSPSNEAELRTWREALRWDLVGLRDRRALARIGSGQTAAALTDLGAALAGGSRDASLVLGRIALREGKLEASRRLFGALLTEGGGEAWARRGWGLSMLP